MSEKITFVDDLTHGPIKKTIKLPEFDGVHKKRLHNSISASKDTETADKMFNNSRKVMKYLIDPAEQDLSKTLCVGKVQSGKTSFFICATALAFDNKYDVAYLIGGTKNSLRDQNAQRADEEFLNDNDIEVYDVNDVNEQIIRDKITEGKKIICVSLKNNAAKKNLGKLVKLSEKLSDIPTLVIDDEGDEYTPGTPKKKNKGTTHNNITDVINNIKCCTYLSVTATPQANMLISTLDSVSPDFVVLVEPGEGYVGGNEFHDTLKNEHVITINDSDEFNNGFPKSFKEALYWFIMSACLKDDSKPYSMLVHPSQLTRIQNDVAQKIIKNIELLIESLSPGSIGYDDAIKAFENVYDKYCKLNDVSKDFDKVKNRLACVLKELKVEVHNGTPLAKETKETEKDKLYKIYVGGEILGRGLTIKNLCCTYIYRDSKESAIDSLYQRARWFGYKRDYFDICRVYMTEDLKKKFIAIVENENDMWNSIRVFLEEKINFKEFPRVFTLNYDSDAKKLVLTRKTVSNTVILERVNPGYTYDKTIMFDDAALDSNRKLLESFIKKHKDDSEDKQIGTSSIQTHKIIKMKYSDFYDEFLSKYKHQINAKLGPMVFKRFLDDLSLEDVLIVVMRYQTGEQRSLDKSGDAISELPQGYNINTDYPGDKVLYNDTFNIQIHLVYIDDFKNYMPILAVNNPLNNKQVKYVTGDNYYGL